VIIVVATCAVLVRPATVRFHGDRRAMVFQLDAIGDDAVGDIATAVGSELIGAIDDNCCVHRWQHSEGDFEGPLTCEPPLESCLTLEAFHNRVEYVLFGRVQRLDARFAVTIQLFDVATQRIYTRTAIATPDHGAIEALARGVFTALLDRAARA